MVRTRLGMKADTVDGRKSGIAKAQEVYEWMLKNWGRKPVPESRVSEAKKKDEGIPMA